MSGAPIHIDVVVPTYKRPAILCEALASVRDQTYPHFTCWITEDGETEATRQAVAPFLADKRFRYLPGPHHGAPAGPRNRGIRAGSGEFVAFLDDDDRWLPEKLERQVAFMARHPDCALVGTNAYRWDPRHPFDFQSTPAYFTGRKANDRHIPYRLLVRENPFIVSSVLIRRSMLDRSGLFNESLHMAEDYELWLRLAAVGSAWNLGAKLLVFRDTPPTYYNRLDRQADRTFQAHVLALAFVGDGTVPSPLQETANRDKARLLARSLAASLAVPSLPARWLATIGTIVRNRR